MVLLSHDGALGVSGDAVDPERSARAPVSPADRSLLISLLTGTTDNDATRQADDLLLAFQTVSSLLGASNEAIESVAGPGARKVLDAARSLLVKAARAEIEDRPILGSTRGVVAYLRVALAHQRNESAHALFLNSAKRLMRDELVATGTFDRLIFHPREIVRRALELGASGMILAHNHPSGDATPSTADIKATQQLDGLCRAFDIQLLDHIVVTRSGHASLRAMRQI